MDSKSSTELLQPIYSDGDHSMCMCVFLTPSIKVSRKGSCTSQKNRPINTKKSVVILWWCDPAVDLNFKQLVKGVCLWQSQKKQEGLAIQTVKLAGCRHYHFDLLKSIHTHTFWQAGGRDAVIFCSSNVMLPRERESLSKCWGRKWESTHTRGRDTSAARHTGT